jgi:hypothetical protein
MADEEGQQYLMPPDEFRKFFTRTLSDEKFQSELAVDAFGALERAGFKTSEVPAEIRAGIARQVVQSAAGKKKYKCSVCGVCGLCSLCGKIDAGSGSAALWAILHIFNFEGEVASPD